MNRKALTPSHENFVTRALEARRDWGYAPEYVEAMWLKLQQEKPGDYVIGTGVSHAIREFVQEAFSYAGLDWQKYVRISPTYFRPTEVDYFMTDCSKACKELVWAPKIQFKEVVRIMVDADLEEVGLASSGEGKKILEERFDGWYHWKGNPIELMQGKKYK